MTFFASDGTDQGTFFCFDDIAHQLIRVNCDVLMNRQRTTPGFPAEIMKLISKTFTFGIHLTEESFTDPTRRIFQIDAIKDRSDRRNSTLNIELPAENTHLLPPPQSPLTILETPSSSKQGNDQQLPSHSTDSPLLLVQYVHLYTHIYIIRTIRLALIHDQFADTTVYNRSKHIAQQQSTN